MFLDACLLCAGASGEERSMLDESRRFVEENTLVYSVAINSWLNQEPMKHSGWASNLRYVPEDNASRIVERIHSSLGARNEAKEWLAACLLKTIKDNQRWHKRTELIDGFPRSTSYFRRLP